MANSASYLVRRGFTAVNFSNGARSLLTVARPLCPRPSPARDLHYLFETLPHARQPEDIEALLPHHLTPERLKILNPVL
jgi:hypothetical protein